MTQNVQYAMAAIIKHESKLKSDPMNSYLFVLDPVPSIYIKGIFLTSMLQNDDVIFGKGSRLHYVV